MLVANPQVDSPVKLDLRLIEADQVATPDLIGSATDQRRRRDRLRRLRQPGRVPRPQEPSGRQHRAVLAATTTACRPASMIHYFRADRPGQSRGIPEITPALPLFAQLRRYTLAVLAAAETAADFAAVLYTDAPANGEADPVEPMDLVELERRMATVLPGGWKLGQIQAEQPATDLRRVQEGDPQRDRPLPEHAVQRRRRQLARATTTPPAGSIIRPTTSRSASTRTNLGWSCSTACCGPGSTRRS